MRKPCVWFGAVESSRLMSSNFLLVQYFTGSTTCRYSGISHSLIKDMLDKSIECAIISDSLSR